MNNLSIGSIFSNWTTAQRNDLLFSVAVGAVGGAIIVYGPSLMSSCCKKVSRVFSENLYRISLGAWGQKPFDSAIQRYKITTKMIQKGMKRKLSLRIGDKEVYKLQDGSKVFIRKPCSKGDSFFTCAVVGLVEFLYENKGHLEHLIDLIQDDKALLKDQDLFFLERETSIEKEDLQNYKPFKGFFVGKKDTSDVLTKEKAIEYLKLVCLLPNKECLDSLFSDNKFMDSMIFLLKHLMGSSIEKENDLERNVARASHEELYADMLKSIGDNLGEKQFSPKRFQELIRVVKYEISSPPESCIRLLCQELGFSFNLLTEDHGHLVEKSYADDLPQLSKRLLLQDGHYSIIYFECG